MTSKPGEDDGGQDELAELELCWHLSSPHWCPLGGHSLLGVRGEWASLGDVMPGCLDVMPSGGGREFTTKSYHLLSRYCVSGTLLVDHLLQPSQQLEVDS